MPKWNKNSSEQPPKYKSVQNTETPEWVTRKRGRPSKAELQEKIGKSPKGVGPLPSKKHCPPTLFPANQQQQQQCPIVPPIAVAQAAEVVPLAIDSEENLVIVDEEMATDLFREAQGVQVEIILNNVFFLKNT